MPKRSIREKIISAQTVEKYFLQFHLRQFFFQTKRFGSKVHIARWTGRPFFNLRYFPTLGGVERQLWRRRGVVGLWDCDASRLQAGLPCTGLRLTNNSSLPCLSWSGSLIILWTLNSHHVDEENWKISKKYLPIDENWGITPEWRFRVEIPLEMKQRLSVAWILSTLIFKAADDRNW